MILTASYIRRPKNAIEVAKRVHIASNWPVAAKSFGATIKSKRRNRRWLQMRKLRSSSLPKAGHIMASALTQSHLTSPRSNRKRMLHRSCEGLVGLENLAGQKRIANRLKE